ELLRGSFEQPLHVRFVGDVGRVRPRAHAERLQLVYRLFGVRASIAVRDADIGAGAREQPCGRAADAAGSAGDECVFSSQVDHSPAPRSRVSTMSHTTWPMAM